MFVCYLMFQKLTISTTRYSSVWCVLMTLFLLDVGTLHAEHFMMRDFSAG